LQAGLASQDAATVQRAAHSLKGLIANCGGVRAAEAAQRVENAGAAGDLVDAAHLLLPLRQEMDHLKRALDAATPRRAVSTTHAR
jgi:HPt (histidine-containing phosphotransfer) domain-containing protein